MSGGLLKILDYVQAQAAATSDFVLLSKPNGDQYKLLASGLPTALGTGPAGQVLATPAAADGTLIVRPLVGSDIASALASALPAALTVALPGALATPPPIGGATPAAGTFTALAGNVLATGSTASRSLAARFSDVANILDYSAVPSLSIDQSGNIQAAINAAAAAGQGRVFAPAGQFRCASGITIPNGVELVGVACTPAFGATTGTILVFDATVPICVTLGAASNNDTCSLKNITIGRAGGEPATSTVGVKLLDSLECVLEDVFIVNHGAGLWLRSDGVFGTYMFVERVHTAAIADAHVVIDGWPGARFNDLQLGSNGGHDYACNAYVRITGGNTTNASGGPNTIVFDDYHFNQSGGTVGAMLQFASQTSGAIGTVENFKFYGGHCETVNYVLENDSTWPSLKKITFHDSSLDANLDVFNLIAGTSISMLTITDNMFEGPMNLSASGGISGVTITGNVISQHGLASSFAVSGAPTIVVKNNNFGAGMTLSGTAAGGAVVVKDNTFVSGAFSCSLVSAYMDIDQPGWAGSWTPTIEFGGASTGITYATQSGTWQIKGGWVEAEFQVSLSAVGTATGAASVAGLPLPSLVTNHANGSGIVTEYFDMASMVSYPQLAAEGSNAYLQLPNGTQGIQYNQSNFTNGTQLHGYIRYRVL